MSWNKPNGKVPVKGERRNSRLTMLLAASVIATLGVGVVLYFFSSPRTPETSQTSQATTSRIREVTPTQARTNIIDTASRKYADLTREEKLQYYKEKYGDNLPDNLKPIVYYLENPPVDNTKQTPGKQAIFNNFCERKIASLLLVKPGAWMMRPPTYDARFDMDFAQHAVDSIDFSDKDTEEQRALKQAVIDTKKEFIARVKNGEKPSDIMNQAAQELYSLGQYKRNLEHEIKMAQKDASKSDQDIKDIVEAANVMLEKKGLPKLRQPSMLYRKIAFDRASKKSTPKQDEFNPKTK